MPDSIKLPFMPALLLPFAMLLLLLAGCATQPEQPAASNGVEALLGQPPTGAFYRDGKLLLQYGTGKEAVYLGAAWPVNGPGSDQHSYRTAVIDLLTEPAPDQATLHRDWQAVSLFGKDRWKQLVRAILEKLVPDNQASGTLVTIQGIDFVLNRDTSNKLHVYRLEKKPASLQITHSISEDALSAQANAHLRDELAKEGKVSGPALFVVGEDELGSAFVLFDFSHNQSVFITQPASPLPADEKLGFSLRLVDALTLRSHILTALKNPFSVTGRLVWLTTQSSAVLLPYGTGSPGEVPPPLSHQQGMDLVQWEQNLDQLVGRDRYRGSMKPLIDGEAFFVSLVQSIQEARESIDIQLYIFDSDDYALRIADLLKKRSREVKVRVLLDNLGSIAAAQVPAKSPYYSRRKPPLSIANYLQQDSDVEVRSVDNPWLTSDHTKEIVIDHRKAYIGGMNIGREYRYEWHDMMTEVEGPIVGRLQKDFDKHWAYAGMGGDLAFALANMKPEEYAGPAERDDYIDIRPLYTRTGDPQILRAQLAAIRKARSYIYVEQPYVSDDEVISELIDARRRGVDVRVVLPTRNDSGFMDSANLVAAKAFINNRVRVYGYPGMTHVKAAIYDGWACLGSANFDKLSLRINQETDLATSDPGFVGQLRHDLFDADFARSREWTEAQPVKWTDYISEFIADQL
jgi:cardiolipin synthase